MRTLAVLRAGVLSCGELAARSFTWDRAREDARLVIGVASGEATVLGAFQRGTGRRRGSGGGTALVRPGTVWMQLSLSRADALVPCTADKLLNRYVRPLLRALTRVANVPVSYFGRDWISAAHRPVGLVGFAHDASSGRCLFEAIVGLRSPFAEPRPSFLGKAPVALDEIARGALDPEGVVDAIVAAYGTLADEVHDVVEEAASAEAIVTDPPWAATREEAIGIVGAGRDASGVFRIGGDLMASRDAIARLEERVARGDEVGRAVDEELTGGGAIVFGVRSLASIRDVIVEAQNIA